MENTHSEENTAAKDTLKALKEEAAALASKEAALADKIKDVEKGLKKADSPPPSTSKIHHGVMPTEKDTQRIEESPRDSARKITIQLSDYGVPSIPYDLGKPYDKRMYKDEECQHYLDVLTDGAIKERVTEMERESATQLIVLLEEERAKLRQKFATYVELPANALVGQPADELERKLFMRHFRNKEAQHRVFMIGFSVAIFCVIGAVLADAMSEQNQQLVTIAAFIGAGTTAFGIIGHLTMRFSDASNEKRAVRMIQELSLLDNTLDKIRIALR